MDTYDRYGDYAREANNKDCNHVSLSIGFALLGLAAGALTALLLAPQSGDDLRHGIRRTAYDARNRGSDLLDNVRGKVMPFRKRVASS
ncbi:MAG: YtxH domain-containing protein [Acidobacteriaceae bacterium]